MTRTDAAVASATPFELRPVTALRGVGESLADKLAKLGITTIQDLLFLLPLRYEDRTRVVPIGSLQVGERAVVEGEILLTEVAFRGRRQLLCRIRDGSGSLTLRFFHFSNAQQQALVRGERLRCFGEIRRGPGGPEIIHPEYRRVPPKMPPPRPSPGDGGREPEPAQARKGASTDGPSKEAQRAQAQRNGSADDRTEGTQRAQARSGGPSGGRTSASGDVQARYDAVGRASARQPASTGGDAAEESLTPIYPLTEGVQQGRLRQLTAAALQEIASRPVRDWLPPPILAKLQLPALRDALQYVHRPPQDADVELLAACRHPTQRRLAFEELLAHQLSLRLLRREIQSDPGWKFGAGSGDLVRGFLASLPFTPTAAQMRAWKEIERDLTQSNPMLRLVQGDVGCGKTVVAALAAVRAVEAGFQAAVMAPTELLAEQHARNFSTWLAPLDLNLALMTGKRSGAARARALADIASGDAKIAIGTHALFQQDVAFHRLGLVIVDEQHRFGVHQRLLLREKGLASGRYPHQLIMTATPIPRTLAMTAYADLDVSIIDELPPGRTPVKTVALPEQRRDEVVLRIRDACRQGRQAYWVCPLVEESDQLAAQAAEETAKALSEALSELSVGLVHGRMAPREKEAVMTRFKEGKIDLLVATTVIEVGVDVPNASLMVIENAERMGLAQLHQLRGRVGRGAAESTCVLLYRAPISEVARERLGVMRSTNDGFEISRRDLELRGPGELLGTRQTGLMQMRVADLVRDADLLPHVQSAAELMLNQNEANIAPLLRRWIGQDERFGKV